MQEGFRRPRFVGRILGDGFLQASFVTGQLTSTGTLVPLSCRELHKVSIGYLSMLPVGQRYNEDGHLLRRRNHRRRAGGARQQQ
jgi:hypothetical protein